MMHDGPSSADHLRASTGVAGLDYLLRGGLPANRLHLIEGDPGTGKTTLALRFLLEGRDRGEPCLYVTLSETEDELRAVARSHDWSLDGVSIYQLSRSSLDLQGQYTLFHPSEVELGETMKEVLEAADRVRPTRLVFDSLSEMRLLARDPLRYRRQILMLKERFVDRSCTVLLLDDHTGGDKDIQLRSIAHGVILLEQQVLHYGATRRRIRIVKLRGVPAVEGFHDFKIRRGGLEVYPQLVAGGPDRDSRNPIVSGDQALDELVGGGLSWGTCTLFIGPAGVGKSTLAAQYVSATATKTPAAIYLFDERRQLFLDRCDALGMSASARLEKGDLSVEQIAPGEVSPGEFAHRISRRVDDGCRVIMIDSLNGYENAMPMVESPTSRMHELLAYLSQRGVATMLVAAQHGILGSMVSSLDVSYLADCVIMLRFFETSGSVRKAISVMKKRTGAHESTIREFAVGPKRIRIGQPLREFHGVLTGVPQYVGKSEPLLRHGRDRH